MKLQHLLAAALAAAALSGCATVATSRVAERPPSSATTPAPAAPPAGSVAAAPAPAAAAKAAPATTAEEPPARLAAAAEKSQREVFAEGVAAFEAGKYEEARAAFINALRRSPDDVGAQFNLGVIAERQGDLPRAQRAYETARKLDPTYLPSVLNLGHVYRLQEKYPQAISLYEQALSAPEREYDVSLLNNLVVAYRLAKQYGKAEATARKVLSRASDNVLAYKNLALVYYEEGNYRLAEFITGNARKLDDKDPGLYNILGLIYLKLGEPTRALAQFQKAVALDDAFAPGHLNIGAMALSHRDYEGAERELSKVLAVEPTSYEARLYYAYALDGQKGRDAKKGLAAGEAFEKVLAVRAEQPEAVCGAGWAYAADRAGYDKAVSFLERCRGLRAGNAPELQLIDLKLKGIAAMKQAPPPTKAEPAETAAKARPAGGDDSAVIEKVSEDAAKQEGAAPAPDSAVGGAGKAGVAPAPAQAPAPAAPKARPGT